MRTRIRCPYHQEQTASLVRRKNDWFCYGACQRAYTQTEVEERVGEKVQYEIDENEEYKEDLEEKFNYIESLRTIKLRGLQFPADERGYYLCWPERQYYKYRLFSPGKGSKYIGPKGHTPPIFWARKRDSGTLFIVEGEINCASLSLAFTGDSVCSLGSASMFNTTVLEKHLTQFKRYSKLIIVLDKDAAGHKALIESKAFFLYKIPFVKFVQLEQDCNEILCEKGPEALREALRRADFK